MAPLPTSTPPSNGCRTGSRVRRRVDRDRCAQSRRPYTPTDAGPLLLRARAGHQERTVERADATLTIHIRPPWWRTRGALAGWFGLALGAAGLVWTAARRREKVKVALLERETLLQESLTDPLTGLHNRRFLITCLQREVPKILRDYAIDPGAAAGGDLLLLLMDVDYFKSINDRHSHGVGDRVLAQSPTRCRSTFEIPTMRSAGRDEFWSSPGVFSGPAPRIPRNGCAQLSRRSGRGRAPKVVRSSRSPSASRRFPSCRTTRMRCPGSRHWSSPITDSG